MQLKQDIPFIRNSLEEPCGKSGQKCILKPQINKLVIKISTKRSIQLSVKVSWNEVTRSWLESLTASNYLLFW